MGIFSGNGSGRDGETERMMDYFSALPEGCILQILSMTSPRDACRSSATSSVFKVAADSDSAWEKFLPSDYRQIISRSVSPVVFSTKKQLYFTLCDSPLLLDGGKLSFALDKGTGKKCYTLPAQEVGIAWKDDSRYWLDIWGRINTAMLSPNTTYAAYLIFKITAQRNYGLSVPIKASVRFVKEGEDEYEDANSNTVFLTSWTLRYADRGQNGQLPQTRTDRSMEIELGEFNNDEGDDGDVEMRLREVSSIKTGLIVEGFEVRPKVGV